MTRLSDYLRAERQDRTEPASFYVPGAENWASGLVKARGPGREAKAAAAERTAMIDGLESTGPDDAADLADAGVLNHLKED